MTTELNITVEVVEEAGFLPALMGLGLSYGVTSEHAPGDIQLELPESMKLVARAEALAPLDKGHNKFLESIQVWLDIKMPRYWWQEFDTYRVGVTKQSESTMHTIAKRKLTQNDFVSPISALYLAKLNSLVEKIKAKDSLAPDLYFRELKNLLPEGFVQRRIVCLNYKVLRHMYLQRHDHRLIEWQYFFSKLLSQVESPEFITERKRK
jgi:hypothetical protein